MENNTWAHVDMEFVRLDSSSDKFQDEKTRIIAKQTMGATQFTNSQILTFSYRRKQKKYFQIHGQNRPVANLPVVDPFPFSAAGNAITKATEYVTFSFSPRILISFPF